MMSTERLFSPKPTTSRKPPVPKKSHCPLPAGRDTTAVTSDSPVKQMVGHLNQQDGIVVSLKAKERGEPCMGTKTTLTVKHRAPQLCQKREGEQKCKQNEDGEGPNNLPMNRQGGRSDGMEVEAEVQTHNKEETVQGSAAPPTLLCKNSCTCICHQQRPGMRLVWVPKEGVSLREEQTEKVEQMKFQQVPDVTTRDGKCQNSKEFSLTAFGPPKFYHRSHWSTPISQSPHIQPGPKVPQDTPPPIPPRIHHKADKPGSLNEGSSSTPPTAKVHPSPPHLPPKHPHDHRKALNSHYHPQSKEKDETDLSDWVKVDPINKEEPSSLLAQSLFADLVSCLKDEPLYQEYRAKAINKEIQQQVKCASIGSMSSGEQQESEDCGNRLRAKRGPTQNFLWQELPSVRNSGVLPQLSPEECKRQESMFEVLTSEASYLRSLRVLTDHFLDSRDLDETLIIRDKKTLFSNVVRVREVSERFLKDLEQRIGEGPVISDICDIIHHHAQHNFSPYMEYIRNQVYQDKIYSSLMQKNTQFMTVITRLQESPLCQRLPFNSFLLLPFQRITRIKMLIENILKRTQEGTKEEQTASQALTTVSQIIEECNKQVGKMKQMEDLLHIAQMLEFHKLKAIPVVSQRRFLEKRGELHEMTKGGTLFSLRPKFTPIYLFLFNDLLIFTYKKSAERYIVTDHAHRSLAHVQAISDEKRGSGFDRCFCLMLLENHQGCTHERLLKAPTESDMHRWMAAFPNLTNPDQRQDEKVYEDWDCPQVQCSEQYVAQQADELNLEPTNIINVLRKTNEGWYEGMRLSDGKKGWFPASNVLEITNEHVRRRNLREQYRISRAAFQAQEPEQASKTLYSNAGTQKEQ
ncbi:rho guanine nucleotide exchange factor 15-like isoform X2 [Conger conger]|uniref:rho guanine nucleotide exchange factor 15-like isoform X2 n=1 Tax=Conger conger TaxID=82655 RepID=UPI002A5A4663|nr:rho guanine nucleotide exchange factor 15-like isoform X2 [Conger conger]